MNHASVLGILFICSVLFFVYPNKNYLKSGKQIALIFFSQLFGKLKYVFSEKLTIQEHPEVQIHEMVYTAICFKKLHTSIIFKFLTV